MAEEANIAMAAANAWQLLYQRAETLTHPAALAVFTAHDHPYEITGGFGV